MEGWNRKEKSLFLLIARCAAPTGLRTCVSIVFPIACESSLRSQKHLIGSANKRQNLFFPCLVSFNSEFHLYVQTARQKPLFTGGPLSLVICLLSQLNLFPKNLNCLAEKKQNQASPFVFVFCELWQTRVSGRSCRQVKLTAGCSSLRVCSEDQLPPGLTHVVTLVALAVKAAHAGGVIEKRSFLRRHQGWHVERSVFGQSPAPTYVLESGWVKIDFSELAAKLGKTMMGAIEPEEQQQQNWAKCNT